MQQRIECVPCPKAQRESTHHHASLALYLNLPILDRPSITKLRSQYNGVTVVVPQADCGRLHTQLPKRYFVRNSILYCRYLSGRLLFKTNFSRSSTYTGKPLIVSNLVSVSPGRTQHYMRVYNTSLTVQSNFSLHAPFSARRSLWPRPKGVLSGLQQRTEGSSTSAWCLPQVSGRRSFVSALVAKAAPTDTPDDSAARVAADTVLIVESKTKAKKIQKFLGPSFKVRLLTPSVQAQ